MKQFKTFYLTTLILLVLAAGICSQTTQAPAETTNIIRNGTTQAPAETTNIIRNGTCRFAPGLVVGDEPRVMECCNIAVRRYQNRWSLGRVYLTTYLQSLKSWGCPQFEEQCSARYYAINEFSKLVYDYFCNKTDFISQCYDELSATIMTNNIEKVERNWSALINELDSNSLSLSQLSVPCIQVALYEAEEEHLGEYHEVIELKLPSCRPTWCGYDGVTLRSKFISVWNCMSNR